MNLETNAKPTYKKIYKQKKKKVILHSDPNGQIECPAARILAS